MSSFLLWCVLPLKAKKLFMPHILLHFPYLCLIEVSYGWDSVMCGNIIFSCKEIATNHKSTIHLLFECTWLCGFILILNCLLSFFLPILLCWICLWLSSCVLLYWHMLLTIIVVLDCLIGMEHFILLLFENTADWNI